MKFTLKLLAMSVICRQHEMLVRELALARAERDFFREQIPAGQRLCFSEAWRRTFLRRCRGISWSYLERIFTACSIRTLQRWASELKKGGRKLARRTGRPRTPAKVVAKIKAMAEETGWGSVRIAGSLKNLDITIDPRTVARIMREHGFDPKGRKSETGTWKTFITEKKATIAATDFFTVPVWTWKGFRDFYVLFFIHLGSRRVEIAGVTEHPDEAFMNQVARNVTMDEVGFFSRLGIKHLIHDLDTKFCASFDHILEGAHVNMVDLPPRSPNLNAFAERWVWTIKSELFNRAIIVGEAGLHRALNEFVIHYNRERNHQGIGNVRIDPEKLVGDTSGPIRRRQRLGGLLNYYYRDAA